MSTSTQENALKDALITAVHRTGYMVEHEGKIFQASLSGRFHYLTFEKSDYPVVGDKVYVRIVDQDKGIIESLQTRKNVLKRSGVKSDEQAQLLAANVDLIFVCMAMDHDFHLKKLQNFLSLTYDTQAETVILLTKKDLAEDTESYINKIRERYHQEIMLVSSFEKEDLKKVQKRIGQKTSIFVGSSGVGKSSIINGLLGEEKLLVQGVRASDSQGRHTTTHRELIHLPNGGVVIDTPGIRVVYSHMVEDLEDAFEEVALLAEDCKFRDCKHEEEPACNVRSALADGRLSRERFEAYQKILKLNRYHKQRDQERKRIIEKKNAYPKG
jgi:ribosome biogenesis GTPase